MKRLLLAAILLTSSLVWSEDPDEYCAGLKGQEVEAYKDIDQYLKYMNRKKPNCDEIFKKFDAKYFDLSTQIYRQYREYLNKFLTDYSQDYDVVKNFQKMAATLREGQVAELINAHADKKTPETEKALYALLSSRAKLIKTPAVHQNCELKGKKSAIAAQNQKLNDSLITKDIKLNTNNICASVAKGSNFPLDQKSIRFQLEGGRAMVWFCHQKYDSNGATLYDTKASCLAYDLKVNKMMLGDQRQSHLYGNEKPFEIADSRMILAKSHGYAPLTYLEFIRKNRSSLPAEPKFFYLKIPKECSADMARVNESARLATRALLDMEKTSGQIEY